MNYETIIRKGYMHDINFLADLLIELFSIETDFTINREKHITGIRRLISDEERSIVFVAECNGSVIGMITGQLVISTAIGEHSVLLEDMCVKSSHRNKGIGTMLVERLTEWGHAKGA